MMPPNSPRDIKRFQESLIFEINSLIDIIRGSGSIGSEKDDSDLGKWIASLSEANKSVIDLEIRLPIIALMKAGKSTVLNAIAQRDIVPSRDISMTVFPTEIRLVQVDELADAKLELSTESIKKLEDVFVLVKKDISQLDDQQLNDRFGGIPKIEFVQRLKSCASLKQLLNYVESGSKSYIEGDERINSALRSINDFGRTALKLEIPLPNSIDLLITAPFSGSQTEDLAGVKSLVIVDSPGADEANVGLDLGGQLDSELQKSSVILLILDYTKLNSKEDKNLYYDKISPRLDQIGKDKLYVVVNKIDRKSPSPQDRMYTEDVKTHVCSFLGLEASSKERIFEISALHFLRSQSLLNFVSKLDFPAKNDEETIKTIKSSRQMLAFLGEVAGYDSEDREEMLKNSPVNFFTKKADKFIAQSGFKSFFTNVILQLSSSAASTAISSQTNVCLKISTEFTNKLLKDIQDYNHKVDALEEVQSNLKKDLALLKEVNLDELSSAIEKLAEESKSLIDTCRSKITKRVSNFMISAVYRGTLEDYKKLFKLRSTFEQNPEFNQNPESFETEIKSEIKKIFGSYSTLSELYARDLVFNDAKFREAPTTKYLEAYFIENAEASTLSFGCGESRISEIEKLRSEDAFKKYLLEIELDLFSICKSEAQIFDRQFSDKLVSLMTMLNRKSKIYLQNIGSISKRLDQVFNSNLKSDNFSRKIELEKLIPSPNFKYKSIPHKGDYEDTEGLEWLARKVTFRDVAKRTGLPFYTYKIERMDSLIDFDKRLDETFLSLHEDLNKLTNDYDSIINEFNKDVQVFLADFEKATNKSLESNQKDINDLKQKQELYHEFIQDIAKVSRNVEDIKEMLKISKN